MKAIDKIKSTVRRIRFVSTVIVISALAFLFYDYSEKKNHSEASEFATENPGNLDFKVVTLKSSTSPKKLGSIIMDLEGPEMNLEEIQLLQHPSIAGIQLSKKNFKDKNQIKTLIKNIRSLRNNILIIVDDETAARAMDAGETHDLLVLTKKSRQDLKDQLEKLTNKNSHKLP